MDVIKLGIVHLVPSAHGLDYRGILTHEEAEYPFCSRLLAVVEGLGEYYDVAFKTLALEIFQGDGVADATIKEKVTVVDFDGAGDYGH